MTLRKSVLAKLGIRPDLEATYDLIRPLTGQTPAVVARAVDTSPEGLGDRLGPLVDLGLVTIGDTVEVRTPGSALAVLVADQTDAIAAALGRIDRLREAIPVVQDEPEPLPDGGSALHGASMVEEGVEDVLADWISRSREQVSWLRPGPFGHHDEGKVQVALRSAMARGVRSRAIYPALALEQVPDVVMGRADAGEEVRFVAQLPGRMAIVDGIGAMFPEPWMDQHAGVPGVAGNRRIQLHQAGILSVFDAYFEEVWQRAIVLPTGGGRLRVRGSARAADRRLLLELLADGAKDEQIARTLGASLRTVRRRIAGLLEELGVESRFQAGVEAVRRGWI